MAESLKQSVERAASRGGWKNYFFHVVAIIFATWLLALVVEAALIGHYPTTFRASTLVLAFGLGLYAIPLIVSFVLLRFKRLIGWISWVALCAFYTYNYAQVAA
ncbi:hypothetical protein [Stenotrophomonas sp. MMGLT7]|uniref:hypothetical protein n=1 Tax=Stenotrophomonas sp. MMGLT7 TaxID=2901227 RepID=UPI001E4157E8|nr:hypothetical protein [Stenotrophomonas sp. MMGLT7]MCD7098990.1 hypothetical protein [Stenotrophomonas sp. MMGLT7]MCD7099001.1 hypothetical protein [Stenotrophomonas sp. MMGLT7]